MNVKIEESWKGELRDEFEEPYFKELTDFVKKEYKDEVVYPAPKYIFNAFELCPFDRVKVVILGQDPYHNVGQANGLCFAVNESIQIPPSLQNIYKEIAKEYDVPYESLLAKGGDLSHWARQGVLLLNATLTVRAHLANSHAGKGWEQFTDAVIQKVSDEREHIVFMLWRNYAKKKGARIDFEKHCLLESAHPSPLSAHNGFFGNNHFKLANDYLLAHGEMPIEWV